MKKVLDSKELQWIEDKVNSMTVDEKIAQITCTKFADFFLGVGQMKDATFEEYAAKLDEVMAKYPVGNVFFGSEVIHEEEGNAERAHFITSYLQSKVDIPMLISGDVESGAGAAVGGLTALTNLYSLGVADDEAISYKYGELTAKSAKAIGYNWAYAPVVDLARNWISESGGRNFGSDSDLIIKHAKAVMHGMQDYNLGACAKHFPGHDSHVNPHIGTSSFAISKEEWLANEGKIYKELSEDGLMSVMAGHVGLEWAETFDEHENGYAPASCSGEAIDGVLRDMLGFDGVVVTDGKTMAAFMNWKTERERVIDLYNGGIDMLLFANAEDIDYMREAIASGEIPMEKVNKSVRRVLKMKLQLELFDVVDTYDQLDEIEEEVKELRAFLETKCVTCVKDHHKLLPLSKDKIKTAAVLRLDNGVETGPNVTFINQLKEYGIEVDVYTTADFSNWDVVPKMQLDVENGKKWDAYFILFAQGGSVGNSRPDGASSLALWRSAGLIESAEPILVSFTTPLLLRDMQHIKTFVATFSNGGKVIEYVPKAIFGEAEMNYKTTYFNLENE